MSRSLKAAVAVFVIVQATQFTRAEDAVPPTDAEIGWIKANAISFRTSEAEGGFEDLQPLKALIGDARIVSLGEGAALAALRAFFRCERR